MSANMPALIALQRHSFRFQMDQGNSCQRPWIIWAAGPVAGSIIIKPYIEECTTSRINPEISALVINGGIGKEPTMEKVTFLATAAAFAGVLSISPTAFAGPTDSNNTLMMSQNAAATPQTDSRMNDHDADDNNANSNGRYSTDRDKGFDRAEDRASAQGLEHGQAFKNDKDADDKRADADDRRGRYDADDKQKNDHDADDRRAANDHDLDDRGPRERVFFVAPPSAGLFLW